MRNTRVKFGVSSRITDTNKLVAAIERKLPDDLITRCNIAWERGYAGIGLEIRFCYFSDDIISKNIEITIFAESYRVYVKVEESVCHRKEDYRIERRLVENKEFDKSSYNEKNWDKATAKAQKDAVAYIVDNITKHFGTNAEKFINNIK